ncbi:MAG: D-aminoacyl-tRNA deacylase [Opitutales bacterium]
MRAVVQRVSRAEVVVEGRTVGRIGRGLLVFLGVGQGDSADDAAWLARKVPQIRIFEDAEGRMNRSVQEIGGEVMVISQFTLFGNLRKGTRPSFNRAAPPELAVPLYEQFTADLEGVLGRPVARGVFGAHMDIAAHNDGPVTLVLDTRDKEF